MSRMTLLATASKSISDAVVISPNIQSRFVVQDVSHATREFGSPARAASRMPSETWSQILSGCPSETDSDVSKCLKLPVAM